MKKYIENDTANMLYVGGCAIAPGEGREVDVPDDTPAQAPANEPDPDAPLRELLTGSVGAVKAGLADLSEATLARLAALEGGAKAPRKTLLEALADEAIRRADEKLKSDPL